MKRSDINEFYYIAPIANVPGIIRNGILSHARAEHVAHHSIAMQEVQERRQDKQIPRARRLHEYANLYFDAHNAMLSKRRSYNDSICVLRVDVAVLDLQGVVIADCNASSDWVHFYAVPAGLAALDSARIFARYWTHPDDPIDEMRHRSQKCAEVLVPDWVDPSHIMGAYVANSVALAKFVALDLNLNCTIRSDMFF